MAQAPSTVRDFVALVRKSGLVEDRAMQKCLQRLSRSGAIPNKPKTVAKALIQQGLLTCFQAQQLLIGRHRGFVLANKYRVLELIGIGGMGRIYLCEHMLMRHVVAVKVLPTDKAEDEATVARFYREARAAASLDHPNIVRAYDVDRDGQWLFLVMNYVDGTSLLEIVKRHGPMDLTRACHYTRQAAVGLQHAHETGWIHRDIKPGNILLDRQGLIKILDMGLARLFHDHADMLTQKYGQKSVLGTVDYLAPEQAIDCHAADLRADVYSLGATFYFLLTNQSPYGDASAAQKLIWQQVRPPDPIHDYRPDVPDALAAIIEKMMMKNPADRYQSAAEVADALEPWTRTPISPPPEEEMPRLSPAARKAGVQKAAATPSGILPAYGAPPTGRSPAAASPRRTAVMPSQAETLTGVEAATQTHTPSEQKLPQAIPVAAWNQLSGDSAPVAVTAVPPVASPSPDEPVVKVVAAAGGPTRASGSRFSTLAARCQTQLARENGK
jgi:serine/threonine protein kinase